MPAETNERTWFITLQYCASMMASVRKERDLFDQLLSTFNKIDEAQMIIIEDANAMRLLRDYKKQLRALMEHRSANTTDDEV